MFKTQIKKERIDFINRLSCCVLDVYCESSEAAAYSPGVVDGSE